MHRKIYFPNWNFKVDVRSRRPPYPFPEAHILLPKEFPLKFIEHVFLHFPKFTRISEIEKKEMEAGLLADPICM